MYALAAETDGIDGVEDNAGAYVMPVTLQQRAALAGKKRDHYLGRNDVCGAFKVSDNLVITGSMPTSDNDFRALLIL